MSIHSITKDDHSTVATEKVFKWWDYPLFVLLTGLSFSAIAYFLFHWFSVNEWPIYPLTYSIMTLILLVVLSNNQGRWFLLLFMRRPRPMAARPGRKVAVLTSFVPGEEPLEMLQETLRALIALDYPHDTWVLDEGGYDQVKALCIRLGANHFTRKGLSCYQNDGGMFQSNSKHGNYNAWLYEIGFDRYEIIAIFDPDHVPDAPFLSHVLGYFEDPKVAYVQAAQAYYNQKASFIARGAAEETYAYYSSVQMACYGMGYPVIIGCHNTHRVTALRQVGGFPAHDAEDLLLTALYRASGWQGVYVPKILARGITPVDWSGYLRQQRRWARSVLDIKLRFHPQLSAKLPFKTRLISFLHGLNYLHRSLIILASMILLASTLVTGTVPSVVSYHMLPRLGILCAVLQLCEFYRQRFYLDWKSEWGLHWRVAVLHLAKWPYLLLALRDVFVRRRVPYALTAKIKSDSERNMLGGPHMIVIALICTAWTVGIVLGRLADPSLHIAAALVVMASVALILTEHMNFPQPYDKHLRNKSGSTTVGFR